MLINLELIYDGIAINKMKLTIKNQTNLLILNHKQIRFICLTKNTDN